LLEISEQLNQNVPPPLQSKHLPPPSSAFFLEWPSLAFFQFTFPPFFGVREFTTSFHIQLGCGGVVKLGQFNELHVFTKSVVVHFRQYDLPPTLGGHLWEFSEHVCIYLSLKNSYSLSAIMQVGHSVDTSTPRHVASMTSTLLSFLDLRFPVHDSIQLSLDGLLLLVQVPPFVVSDWLGRLVMLHR
jgi:hypothetical protein